MTISSFPCDVKSNSAFAFEDYISMDRTSWRKVPTRSYHYFFSHNLKQASTIYESYHVHGIGHICPKENLGFGTGGSPSGVGLHD